jgi:hypothetical protein
MHSLASLESVVTYGCPPLAMRICNLVSGKSFPATAGFGGAATDVVAGSSGRGAPSLRAFFLAAFSARSRLSASIWALIRARAFASSSFSVSCSGYRVKDVGGYVPCLSFRLSFTFSSSRSFPMSLGDLRVSSIVDGRERVTYLCRFPPDLLVRLGLFRLLCSFLGHMVLQLCELLLLFFFRERLDLQGRPEGAVGWSFLDDDERKSRARRTSSADSSNWS